MYPLQLCELIELIQLMLSALVLGGQYVIDEDFFGVNPLPCNQSSVPLMQKTGEFCESHSWVLSYYWPEMSTLLLFQTEAGTYSPLPLLRLGNYLS